MALFEQHLVYNEYLGGERWEALLLGRAQRALQAGNQHSQVGRHGTVFIRQWHEVDARFFCEWVSDAQISDSATKIFAAEHQHN